MTIYLENPTYPNKNLLDLVDKFNKVVMYQINTWKCLPVYEHSEKEIKKIITFIIATKILRYKFNQGEKFVQGEKV